MGIRLRQDAEALRLCQDADALQFRQDMDKAIGIPKATKWN